MISGKMLRDALISAANNNANQRKPVAALHVFPVPDGDTGTHQSKTMGAAKRELAPLPESVAVGEVAGAAAAALGDISEGLEPLMGKPPVQLLEDPLEWQALKRNQSL